MKFDEKKTDYVGLCVCTLNASAVEIARACRVTEIRISETLVCVSVCVFVLRARSCVECVSGCVCARSNSLHRENDSSTQYLAAQQQQQHQHRTAEDFKRINAAHPSIRPVSRSSVIVYEIWITVPHIRLTSSTPTSVIIEQYIRAPPILS